MEILSSGSFINLENQEKIEQLKYTANELANAASSTAGFVNQEDAASKLALEFWQGLEYMCRENEQAAIQNIFTGEFLERLRELRPAAIIPEVTPTDETPEIVPEQTSQTFTTEDEFLGVLEPEHQEIAVVENTAEIQEIPLSAELSNSTENASIENQQIEAVKNESNLTQTEEVVSQTAEPKSLGDEAENKEIEVSGSLSLPEKEPYQWGRCTVTATIQLLPEGADGTAVRKAVFSVRTHDFAPQISLVELAGNNLTAEIMPELEKVLAKYQSDLPLKVMDKLKKEKTTAKRNAPKPTSEVKTVSQAAAKSTEVSSSQTTESEAPQTSSSIIPPTQTGLQGSLFG